MSFEFEEFAVIESVGVFDVRIVRQGESDINVTVQLEIFGITASGVYNGVVQEYRYQSLITMLKQMWHASVISGSLPAVG